MEARKKYYLDKYFKPEDVALMSSRSPFGSVKGIKVGHTWDTRAECCRDQIHTQTVAGIAGSPKDGAYSIVLSGRYPDDKDFGDFITYSGTGSQDSTKNGMPEDQTFKHTMNRSLQRSCELRRPVRVIRGPCKGSIFAPASGYRYDGLYKVIEAKEEIGKRGNIVCLFQLQRLPNQPPIPGNSPHIQMDYDYDEHI